MKSACKTVVALGMVLALISPALSYLPQFTKPFNGGTPQPDRWDLSGFPVTWRLNPATRDNVSGTRSTAAVMEAAFATWAAAPNAVAVAARGADATATDAGFDGNSSNNFNLVCFVCDGEEFGSNSGTLAVTINTVADGAGGNDGHGGRTRFAGQIVDSDIIFNPAVEFSTGSGAGQDVQTVAVHEVGHYFGLDHSAVVRAIMFPFAPPMLRSLSSDDVAGISLLYPKPRADVGTGVVAGRVVNNSGAGIFGAHVYADPVTAAPHYGPAVRKTPIGTLTGADGSYRIDRLPQDSYVIVVEPLDEPVANGDVNYGSVHGRSLQTNFTTRWY